MVCTDYKPRQAELRMVAVIEKQQAEIELLRAALTQLRAVYPYDYAKKIIDEALTGG